MHFIMLSVLLAVLVVSTHAAVLVIGSSGRLGRVVVSKLVSQGIETVSLVRDPAAALKLPELAGSKIVQGDVTDVDSLQSAMAGGTIDKVIDVHGVRPPRFVKLRDILRRPAEDDITHPYNINYKGTANVLSAMKTNNVKKLVRLTGALVGASCWKPFVALFNFLLSFSNKWHERSEILIRDSGIDYTVVRPSELADEPSAASLSYPAIGEQATPRYLIAVPGDTTRDKAPPIPIPSKISIRDVADLCVQAATKSDKGSLFKSTVICCSAAGDGPRDFNEVMSYETLSDAIFRDDPRKGLVAGKHELATVIYSTLFTAMAVTLAKGGSILLLSIVRALRHIIAVKTGLSVS